MRRDLGSIRKTSSGSWKVELATGRDRDGKRIRRSKTVRGSRKDAERELARMLVEAGKVPEAPKSLTLEDFIDSMYLPSLQVRRNTLESYREKIRNHITPHLGGMALVDIQPYTVEAWLRRLETLGVSPATRKAAFVQLRLALRKAVKWRLIANDSTDAVDAPRVPSRDLQVYDVETLNRLLDSFAGHPIEPLVILACATGMRRSELCGLTWSDIDMVDGVVTVSRGMHMAKNGREVYFDVPKSQRSRRMVDLPQWSMDALRPLRGIGPLVPNEDGSPWDPDKVSRAYKSHLKHSDIPYIPLRDLRNTHATLMLEAGASLELLSRRLGHARTDTTERFYIRTNREYVRGAVPFAETLRRQKSAGSSDDVGSVGS